MLVFTNMSWKRLRAESERKGTNNYRINDTNAWKIKEISRTQSMGSRNDKNGGKYFTLHHDIAKHCATDC